MKLAGIDLNLLVAFDALLSEGSVGAAAARIGLTQPAMSKRLARLRALFRDDLFVRTGEGVRPTERALDLADPIRAALRQIEETLGGYGRFHAARSSRTFRIATTDHVAVTLMPGVIASLQKQAPRISVILRIMNRQTLVGALETGEIDLAIALLPDAPTTLKRATLFHEQWVSLVSENHPEIAGELTLDLFLKYPHLLVTYVGDLKGYLDRLLDEKGLKRHVAASLPYCLAAPAIVARTEMITTLPERVVNMMSWPGVRSFPVPLDYSGYNETMLWHRRNDADAGHGWLRQLISAESERLSF